ncbi:MAG: flagellar assembly protein, partial [Proteobacteria bacterium]
FIEELKKQTGRNFEFLKKVKIEASPEVTNGGCIVQTNYGEVDARVEQRIDSLWAAFQENMPKVKPVVKVAG